MHRLTFLLLACTLPAVDGLIIQAALGGFVAVYSIFAAENVIAAFGFTATGIAVGSCADKLKSIVAFFNGGTISPESVIITFEDIGIEGFALSTKLMLGVIGVLLCTILFMRLRIL